MRKQQPTLPTFGAIVQGEGGRLGAIMRGNTVGGVREPDYAVIVSDHKDANLGRMKWGLREQDVPGASSLTDGLANTIAMAKAGSAAGLQIVGLVIGKHADFYIPSRGEMWALRANVPELFAKEWHWTSTQNSRLSAFSQDFENGDSYWDGKGHDYRVRAVRRIQLHHFDA